MKNIENIKLVLKKIEENPECWNQEKYHCGTAHCFAGHGQIEAGLPPDSSTTKFDGGVFFGFTQREANYYFKSERTLKELKTSTEDFYDRDGYDREGLDHDGYDHNGFNRYGVDRKGYFRHGYNSDGFGRDGYNRKGLDKDNNPKPEITP